MVQKYYTYIDKIKKAEEEQTLLLPILGFITEFFSNDRSFDVWDLHIIVAATCGKIDIHLLKEILFSLSKIGVIRVVKKSKFDCLDNIYCSNIQYSDYKYILSKLYNR